MSQKGLMPIEHGICLRGGALGAGGQHWEGASQHVLYLDGLDPECDTDSKMEFLNKRRLARLLDNRSPRQKGYHVQRPYSFSGENELKGSPSSTMGVRIEIG